MEAKHLAVFSNEKSWDIVVRPGTSTADSAGILHVEKCLMEALS